MEKLRDLRTICAVLFLTMLPAVSGVFLTSRAHGQVTETEETKTLEREKIKSAAVIPFTSTTGLSESLSEKQITDAERLLTISFYDSVIALVTRAKITPLQASEAEYAKINSENPISYYKGAALAAGKSLGVDAVLTGVVSEYRERKGSGIGVEEPASVAFSVELLDTRDGSTLWETYFTETQKPLFQNVYEIDKFFKRGARWITVDELAKEGARKAASDFNEYLTSE